MFLTFVSFLITIAQQSSTLRDYDTWVEPQLWRSWAEEDVVDLYHVNGCLVREYLNVTMIIIGDECRYYPASTEVQTPNMKIKMTKISIIYQNDFVKLKNVRHLVIEYNTELNKLESGCFKIMSSLNNLTIFQNLNLKFLNANVFDGLKNLTLLSLKKNGFNLIQDISQALSPNFVPNIYYLDISENHFKNIWKNDFEAMQNSTLQKLKIILCGIEFIHEDSLLPLKNLTFLSLSRNLFNISTISNLIENLTRNKIYLDTLNLCDLGYRKQPPTALLEVISKSNITVLSLSDNQFEKLSRKDFPDMPKIKWLDLSDNLILTIESNTFQGFANIEILDLSGNKCSEVFSAVTLRQLKSLDLAFNSGNPRSISYFNIANNIFNNMTELIKLRLSNNLIEIITKSTFNGLENLKYLDLNNATLFNVEKNSFASVKNLQYLNLGNNPFQAITLTADVFVGLSKLRVLLLGGCNIYNISVVPSPFTYLSNLTYLGLDGNRLYTLSPNLLTPLISLHSLNLSNNKLIPWNEKLFTNLSFTNLDISQNKFTFLSYKMLEDFQILEYLNFEGNPLVCECGILPSVIWQRNHDLRMKYLNKRIWNIKCTGPGDWYNTSLLKCIKFIRDHIDDCKMYTNNIILVSVLSTLLVLIGILSVLAYVYRFYLKYWIFLISMTLRRHKARWWIGTQNSLDEYTYDAFVSYSCEDRDFVTDLISELENKEPYLKLCVYERDFQIGSVISEAVLENVALSRRTLLVISKYFAKSQWCRWETKLAEYHQLFFRSDDTKSLDDTLVMIKLNEVPDKYITPTLKFLMKTRKYLKWEPEKPTEFWDKLRSTLAKPKGIRKLTISET